MLQVCLIFIKWFWIFWKLHHGFSNEVLTKHAPLKRNVLSTNNASHISKAMRKAIMKGLFFAILTFTWDKTVLQINLSWNYRYNNAPQHVSRHSPQTIRLWWGAAQIYVDSLAKLGKHFLKIGGGGYKDLKELLRSKQCYYIMFTNVNEEKLKRRS